MGATMIAILTRCRLLTGTDSDQIDLHRMTCFSSTFIRCGFTATFSWNHFWGMSRSSTTCYNLRTSSCDKAISGTVIGSDTTTVIFTFLRISSLDWLNPTRWSRMFQSYQTVTVCALMCNASEHEGKLSDCYFFLAWEKEELELVRNYQSLSLLALTKRSGSKWLEC